MLSSCVLSSVGKGESSWTCDWGYKEGQVEATGLGSSPGRFLGQRVGSQRREDMIQSHGEGNMGRVIGLTADTVWFYSHANPGTVGLIICGLQMWFKEEVNYHPDDMLQRQGCWAWWP